jgi:hypothetical protein
LLLILSFNKVTDLIVLNWDLADIICFRAIKPISNSKTSSSFMTNWSYLIECIASIDRIKIKFLKYIGGLSFINLLPLEKENNYFVGEVLRIQSPVSDSFLAILQPLD